MLIVGPDDGVLPLHWNGLDEATAAEERRLVLRRDDVRQGAVDFNPRAQAAWRGRLRGLRASAFLDDIENEPLKHQPMHPCAKDRRRNSCSCCSASRRARFQTRERQRH
jgi:hypothetical protein